MTDRAERWEAQLRKGCLEMAILASLWNGRLYGLEILRILEKGSNLVIAEGTVYPILTRLKAEGLVESEWVAADSGHPRKYYWLTDGGRREVTEMADLWTEFSASLGSLMAPVLNAKGNGNGHASAI